MIIYRDSAEGLKENDMEGFYEGWRNAPIPAKRLKILGNSNYVVIAFDDEKNKAVGFINAISDKALSAYIPLLEVLPEYRGKGIGSELVKKMLDILAGYYMIDVCCDESQEGFYGKFGLKKVTGMVKRNYHNI